MLSEFLDSYKKKFIDRNCLESYKEQLVSLSKEFKNQKLLKISYQDIEIDGVDTIYIDANRDILEQLDTIERDLIFAITICGVVEFIPFEETLKILSKSKELLSRGGVLIIQTLNPENIKLSLQRDSIINLIPQHLLSYAVEFIEFDRYKILRSQENEYLKTQRYINIEQLFRGVSSYYAIVAQKGESKIDIDSIFQDRGVSLQELFRGFEFRKQSVEKYIQKLFNRLDEIENESIIKRDEILLNSSRLAQLQKELIELREFTNNLAQANHNIYNLSIELSKREQKLQKHIDSLLSEHHSLSQTVHSLSQNLHSLSQNFHSLSQTVHSLSQSLHSISQSLHFVTNGCIVVKNCLRGSILKIFNFKNRI